MTDQPLDPGANWCPDCGLPRGVCDCAEYQARETHNDNNPFPHCDHITTVWDSEIEEYRCSECGEILIPDYGEDDL